MRDLVEGRCPRREEGGRVLRLRPLLGRSTHRFPPAQRAAGAGLSRLKERDLQVFGEAGLLRPRKAGRFKVPVMSVPLTSAQAPWKAAVFDTHTADLGPPAPLQVGQKWKGPSGECRLRKAASVMPALCG